MRFLETVQLPDFCVFFNMRRLACQYV